MSKCSQLGDRLGRRKVVNFENTELPRVLTLLDLTTLGVGSTIGVGFYVLAGEVAQTMAGPAVTISFLIAAVASVFAGLCYAEFGGRVPRAGSAYIYTYVCIGEFIAFVIGWNLILEYVIGTASIASGFSGYIDAFFNNVISDTMKDLFPINVSFLSSYPDFLAAALCLLLAAFLAFGVKESTMMNNIVTVINIVVVVYVIVTAATQADPHNWHLTLEDLNDTCSNVTSAEENDGEPIDWGTGGFVPYGFAGIMQGAATCFYGFVGFDVIASTGEEAIRPERNLPLAIVLSLSIIFAAYFGMASVLTLALPYCDMDPSAPLIYLYDKFDMNTAKIIVSVGALFGFSASLFGAIFPMPRVIYAMAHDGLLFRILSVVSRRFRSPVWATMLSGLFAALMAMLFDLDVLIHMMSIGTLQAYTIVALCVMMLRFSKTDNVGDESNKCKKLRYSIDPTNAELQSLTPGGDSTVIVHRQHYSLSQYLRQATNRDRLSDPDELSTSFVSWATLAFCVMCFITSVLLVTLGSKLGDGDVASIVSVSVMFVLSFIIIGFISIQPESKTEIAFKVPLVPWVPAFSCFINLYLMCNLPSNTWIKFVIWIAIGLAIYFLYGVWLGPGAVVEDTKFNAFNDVSYAISSGDVELIIPAINVLPATPTPSAANTIIAVKDASPRRSSEEVVSPLVTTEMQDKVKDVHFEIEGNNVHSLVNSNSHSESEKIIEKKVAEYPVIVPKEELIVNSAALTVSMVADIKHVTDEDDSESAKHLVDEALDNDHYHSQSSSDVAHKSDRKHNLMLTLVTNVDDNSNEMDTNSRSLHCTNTDELFMTKAHSLDDIGISIRSNSDTVLEIHSMHKTSSSVPATPILARTPPPKLRRISSFEAIPPSSPNNPLAKRVNEFIVIPVLEDSAYTNIEQTNVSHDLSSEQLKFKFDVCLQDNDKSAALQNNSATEEFKSEYSTEILDENESCFPIQLPIRNLRLLDTIRERGESKLSSGDDFSVSKQSFTSLDTKIAFRIDGSSSENGTHEPSNAIGNNPLESSSIQNTEEMSEEIRGNKVEALNSYEKDIETDNEKQCNSLIDSANKVSIKDSSEETNTSIPKQETADSDSCDEASLALSRDLNTAENISSTVESKSDSKTANGAGLNTGDLRSPDTSKPSVKNLTSWFSIPTSSDTSKKQTEIERPSSSIAKLRANFEK